jgi:hypothetical protein
VFVQRGEGVVIVDAGGSTIDISAYQKPVGGKKFEEIAAPKCKFLLPLNPSQNGHIGNEPM